jgi:molecular chaperone DnaK
MGSNELVRVGPREFSPAQVSALILGALLDRVEAAPVQARCAPPRTALLDRVEAALGRRPDRAVITVPAFFSDAQRQATRDAGLLAGLQVERLVNEPTAAAMTYQSGQEQTVMVYDLGGGTFDVSILERDEGFLEVRASRGDTHLGGDDLDAGLTEFVLSRVPQQRDAIARDPRAMTRLTEAVERAKITLSTQEEVRILEPFLSGEGSLAVHLDVLVTRGDLERVARPLLARTLRCIDDALSDARLTPQQIDRVLLVGGASRSPIVREVVSAHLKRPVLQDLDADRAVALGASLLAGRASGAEVNEVLVDITPHTLALGALPGSFLYAPTPGEPALEAAPVIARNMVIPVARKRTFVTAIDDQPAIRAPIVQGEQALVEDNTLLGDVCIEDLPPSSAGSPVVEVTFRLDLSGVLHVTAEHIPSGRSTRVSIADSPYQLTAQHREQAQREIEALRPANSGTEVPDAPPLAENDLVRARTLLAKADKLLLNAVDANALSSLRQARDGLTQALERSSPDASEALDALADALLDLV